MNRMRNSDFGMRNANGAFGESALPTANTMKPHSPLAIIVLLVSAWLLAVLFSGCETLAVRPSISYAGRYGDYSVGLDGKTITLDAKVREVGGRRSEVGEGYAK